MANFKDIKFNFRTYFISIFLILFVIIQTAFSLTFHSPKRIDIGINNIAETLYLDTNTTSQHVFLAGTIISGEIINLNFETFPQNNPKKNKNWVGLWQGSQIHYNEKPLHKAFITDTSQNGSIAFDSLHITDLQYIVGFGVGQKNATVAATLYFSKGTITGTSFSTTISIVKCDKNSLIYHFDTPLGNTPNDNDNWVGIWKGKSFTNDGSNIFKRFPVKSNVSSSFEGINGLNLKANTWYTLAYATGKEWHNIAASVSFQMQ